MISRAIPALVVFTLLIIPEPAHPDRVDKNLQLMLEAARQIETYVPGGSAYLLEKLETIRAPVAVVFGYADNGDACENLAEILSDSGKIGTFECTPIY